MRIADRIPRSPVASDIGTPQCEQQEHLRGPHPDAFHDHEMRNRRAIGESRQSGKIDLPLAGPLSQIAEVPRLLLGQPDGSKLRFPSDRILSGAIRPLPFATAFKRAKMARAEAPLSC